MAVTELQSLPPEISDHSSEPLARGAVEQAEPPSSAQTRLIDMMICAIFAAAITAGVVQYSLRHGRLALPPAFDDIGYMADGAMRLQTFYDSGVRGLVYQYLAHPPHSPYSDFLAMGAFALCGIKDWAPYAANALLLFGVFLSANYLLPGLRRWQKIACFLWLAAIPFVVVVAHEFRPDPCAAWLTAMGIMAALAQPMVRAPLRRQVAIGVLFGCAMLAKPPVFPATVVYFLATLFLATVRDALAGEAPGFWQTVRAWIFCLIPFVLIPLPHYLVALPTVVHYIRENTLGEHASIWKFGGSLHDQLLYFTSGPGGRLTLANHFHFLLEIGVALVIIFSLRRRRKELLTGIAMGLGIAMAYAQPTLNPVKSIYFGFAFPIMLTFAVLFWMGRLLVIERAARWRVPWVSALLVLVTMYSLWLFQWPLRFANANDTAARERTAMVVTVYHDVLDHTAAPAANGVTRDSDRVPRDKIISDSPRVVLNAVGDLNVPLLQYMSIRDRTMAEWISPPDMPDPQPFRDAWDDADFVIATESGTGVSADFLLSAPIQDQLLADLRARGDFREIGKYTFSATGRSMYLFEHVYFEGFTVISGLYALEGPFKAFNGHAVRWGLAPATRLRAEAPSAGMYQLSWRARNRVEHQRVRVKLDGIPITEIPLPASESFLPHQISFAMAGGEHELALEYSGHENAGNDTRPMAVLFEELRVTKR